VLRMQYTLTAEHHVLQQRESGVPSPHRSSARGPGSRTPRLSPWASYRTEIESFLDAGEGRVMVYNRDYGRREGMATEVAFVGATVWTLRKGTVASLDFYWKRADARLAAGLGE